MAVVSKVRGSKPNIRNLEQHICVDYLLPKNTSLRWLQGVNLLAFRYEENSEACKSDDNQTTISAKLVSLLIGMRHQDARLLIACEKNL